MPKLDGKGPDGDGKGRGLGGCKRVPKEEKLKKLGKGLGKKRKAGGGDGQGKRKQAGLPPKEETN
jgi:hypothetical protein